MHPKHEITYLQNVSRMKRTKVSSGAIPHNGYIETLKMGHFIYRDRVIQRTADFFRYIDPSFFRRKSFLIRSKISINNKFSFKK